MPRQRNAQANTDMNVASHNAVIRDRLLLAASGQPII